MAQNRVVYDTALGRTDRCSFCRRKLEACVCPNRKPVGGATASGGAVRVQRDRKGRNGKTVTVVTGLPNDAALLKDLSTTLKRLVGSGGAVVDGTIEIQGDHREKLLAKLTELGFKPKLAGG